MDLAFTKETILNNILDQIDQYEGYSCLNEVLDIMFAREPYILDIQKAIDALNKYQSASTPINGIFGAFEDIKYYMCTYRESYEDDELISIIGYDPKETASFLAWSIADYFTKCICIKTHITESEDMITKDLIERFTEEAQNLIDSDHEFLDTV